MIYRICLALTCCVLVSSCAQEKPANGISVLNVSWQKLDTEKAGMPTAIQVWEGEDENMPLKAWFVKVDLSAPEIDIEVLSSNDTDGRQSATDFALQSGACVIVNGGYFKVEKDVYSHIGLLKADGSLVHSATPGIIKDEIRYPVRRSAIGFDENNKPAIGWVSSKADSVFIWDSPVANTLGTPGEIGSSDNSQYWPILDAVEAGPALVVDGQVAISVNEEVFFGTTIPDVHPRTAAGIDEDGKLLLMVVDGRQRNSRGVSLGELASLMKAIGSVSAINLDGGGSSTLVVKNELLNLPTGGTFQREIVSAIGIHCLNEAK
jgi:hypothetical protein